MSKETREVVTRPPRRFARLPHDAQTEALLARWCAEVDPLKAFTLILPQLERGAFLSHNAYNGRYCATLTRESDNPTQLCNAVSGWHSKPVMALVSLAFSWSVLCQSSWMDAHHARLVSEVQVGKR